MTTAMANTWSVRARNLPEHADNPIHTDEGARAAGFESAMVAGTTVHAYLTRPVVEAWGAAWLAGGSSTVAFVGPVLAGEPVDCVPVSHADGSVEVRALVGGDLRARLVAWPDAAGAGGDGPRSGEALPPHVEPLEDGRGDYARRAGEDLALYADDGIVHPCLWPSLANGVMIRHLVDGPWIHTRSRIVHHSRVAVGSDALVEAAVVDRFDTRAGTRVLLDVRISVDGAPVATIEHEAIVSLRPREA